MNVTYIIGAGASAQAIPPVGERFNQRLKLFCEYLSFHSRNYGSETDQKNLKDFLQEVITEVPKHYSVDTYARKLFFIDRSGKYEAFKILLSSYFLFEQSRGKNEDYSADSNWNSVFKETYNSENKKLDPRYDVVYAALLNENTRSLPKNMYFISWNYDIQFELSYASFLDQPIKSAFNDLQVFPSVWSCVSGRAPHAKFLKLNGTAGLISQLDKNTGIPLYDFDLKNDKYSISDVPRCLDALTPYLRQQRLVTRLKSMLHFAWENNEEVRLARVRAKEILSETRELIIIGYSFPLYNRRIDREIFENLPPGTKVHIQVNEKDLNLVEERFRTVAKHNPQIFQRKDLDQFFIPETVL
ncbi:MAG: hypothetical protein U0V74_13490 [Chitinophagales bacterium]